MRSHLSALGVGPIAAERCLNHSPGGLMAIYDQHDFVDERRDALERWADKLIALEAGVGAAHIATQLRRLYVELLAIVPRPISTRAPLLMDDGARLCHSLTTLCERFCPSLIVLLPRGLLPIHIAQQVGQAAHVLLGM